MGTRGITSITKLETGDLTGIQTITKKQTRSTITMKNQIITRMETRPTTEIQIIAKK